MLSTWKGIESALVALATVGAVLTIGADRAEACTCLPPTVESSYNTSSDVIRARIVRRLQATTTTTRYLARVQRTFKGCLAAPVQVVLTTPSSSAACGDSLQVGRDYLINGDRAGTYLGIAQLAITLCDYNQPFAALSAHDREFLNGRMVCCGEKCTCADGTQPVNCFVDPCEVAPDCPDGECVANYCGGCNAEFYDQSGYAVCDWCPSADDCADPQCVDLAGYNFGPCDAVLGVVVQGGQCVEVSGCSADPFTVFGSIAECQSACGLSKR